jgi:uridine kinase
MIGDKIVVKPHHTSAAKEIFALIETRVAGKRSAITIAGQSGSGKSEIASELAKCFEGIGIRSFIFQQDDYFVYPPKTNHRKRIEDINHVGTTEVKLELLEKHVQAFKDAPDEALEKPLVIFEEDRISSETVSFEGLSLVIVEGTYTTLLKNADERVFIDRTYHDTRAARTERSREKIDEFSDKVLLIEHEIISEHKKLASVVVNKDYTAAPAGV